MAGVHVGDGMFRIVAQIPTVDIYGVVGVMWGCVHVKLVAWWQVRGATGRCLLGVVRVGWIGIYILRESTFFVRLTGRLLSLKHTIAVIDIHVGS